MSISCFLTYWGEARDGHAVFAAYRAGPASFLAEAPGTLSVELYTPDGAADPLLGGDTPPLLVAQLRFATPAHAERALASAALSRAVDGFRDLAVSDRCPADDESAFIDYYRVHHPPIMAALPGIRRLEIYTPVAWTNPLALDRAEIMLMCHVSFDSADG